MLPTPSTSHVSFDKVYEPAEDSFLFLDTLSRQSEVEFLSQRFNAQYTSSVPLVLEIGSGSGVILAFLASNSQRLFGRRDILSLATDVNRFACEATADTVSVNVRDASVADRSDPAAFLGCVNGDLTAAIARHSVDVLIFNPPYVPSEVLPEHESTETQSVASNSARIERDYRLLALATDGGADGMEVTDRVLRDLERVLNPRRGVAYILLCAQNKPERVKENIRDWGSQWSVEIVGNIGKQGGWEKLQIIRIARITAKEG